MFQIQGERPYHHLYTRVFTSGKDATPEGTAECTDSPPAPAPEGQVPTRLGHKSGKRQASSPSRYGQASGEDIAVSQLHAIKVIAIAHVVNTKPSTCWDVNVHAARASGTEGGQQQRRAWTEGVSSKIQELPEMWGDAMWGATGSQGGHHTPNSLYNAYKGVL